MAAKAKDILKQALALPAAERATLATSIFESIEPFDPDDDKAWAEEIHRQVIELRSGKIDTIPWAEIRTELEEKLILIE